MFDPHNPCAVFNSAPLLHVEAVHHHSFFVAVELFGVAVTSGTSRHDGTEPPSSSATRAPTTLRWTCGAWVASSQSCWGGSRSSRGRTRCTSSRWARTGARRRLSLACFSPWRLPFLLFFSFLLKYVRYTHLHHTSYWYSVVLAFDRDRRR